MSVNMFEGARRIMKIIFAVIALIGIYAVFDSSPDIKLVYEIPFVGKKPLQINAESCNSLDDAEESSYKTTAKGNDYKLMLCFKASPSDAGEMVIPFETHVFQEVDYDPFSAEYAAKFAKADLKKESAFDPDAYLAEKQAQKSRAQAPKINLDDVVRDEPKPQAIAGSSKYLLKDKQELYDALQKADAVGNKEDAQELADYIRSIDNPVQEAEPDPKFTAEENAEFGKRYAEEKRAAHQQSTKAKNGHIKDPTLLAKLNASNKPQEDINALWDSAKPDYPTNQAWSGAGKYDDKVIKYTRLVNSNFSVSANGEQFVNKQYWPKKAKATLMPIGITVLSICGFWIFCWIIGWVVRGFTGISMGQDRKN